MAGAWGPILGSLLKDLVARKEERARQPGAQWKESPFMDPALSCHLSSSWQCSTPYLSVLGLFTPRKWTLGNEQIDITLIPSKAVFQSRGYLTTGITFQRVHCLLTLSNQGPVFGTWTSWGHVHIPREAFFFIIYILSFLKCHGQGCPKNSVAFFSFFLLIG